MSTAYIAFNFFSAFLIGAGTVFGAIIVGGKPTFWQVIAAIVAGLVIASKDTRSLLKLPAVTNGNSDPTAFTKPPTP